MDTAAAAPVPVEPPDTMTRTPADTGGPALLFIVHDEADYTTIEPLLAIDTSGPVNPPTPQHQADSGFGARWFQRGTSYRLLRANAPAGTIAVLAEQERAHCSPPAAFARYDTAGARPAFSLATNSPRLGGRSGSPRELTGQERTLLDAAALRHLRDSLSGRFSPAIAQVFSRAIAVDSGKPPALLGIYAGRIADSSAIANALVVLEHSEAWYEPTMVQVLVGDETTDWDAFEYVDAIDLEGDGVLEIIVQVMGMETRSFVVFQRGDELWREAFSGGYASAC